MGALTSTHWPLHSSKYLVCRGGEAGRCDGAVARSAVSVRSGEPAVAYAGRRVTTLKIMGRGEDLPAAHISEAD